MRLFFSVIVLTFVLCACSEKVIRKSVAFADTTYQYSEYQSTNRNHLNQTLIKTDRCYIRYDRLYAPQLGEIVATAHREYSRVARDLKFDPTSRFPGIAIVSEEAYRQLTPDASGGFFPGRREKYAEFVYIDGDLWPPGTERLRQVIAHELTHWVLYQLRGRKPVEKIAHLRQHQHSLRAFEEALAQFEDGREIEIKARLLGQFHDSHFLTIAQMDSSFDPATELAATEEFHVLIPILASLKGENRLPGIVRCLGKQTLEEALQSQLGDDYATVDSLWFQKMQELVQQTP